MSVLQGYRRENARRLKFVPVAGEAVNIKYTQDTIFGRIYSRRVSGLFGYGRQILEKCPDCKGKGFLRKETRFTVNIPAGVDKDSSFKKARFGQRRATAAKARFCTSISVSNLINF